MERGPLSGNVRDGTMIESILDLNLGLIVTAITLTTVLIVLEMSREKSHK